MNHFYGFQFSGSLLVPYSGFSCDTKILQNSQFHQRQSGRPSSTLKSNKKNSMILREHIQRRNSAIITKKVKNCFIITSRKIDLMEVIDGPTSRKPFLWLSSEHHTKFRQTEILNISKDTLMWLRVASKYFKILIFDRIFDDTKFVRNKSVVVVAHASLNRNWNDSPRLIHC